MSTFSKNFEALAVIVSSKRCVIGSLEQRNNNKVKKNMDNNNKKHPIGCFLIRNTHKGCFLIRKANENIDNFNTHRHLYVSIWHSG